MTEPVYILGGGRTDFRRNLRKEGRAIGDLIIEAGRAAIADAGIAPSDIGAGVVGNFAAGLFTRQLHLGAFLTEIDEGLRGLPTMHVEAACASGGVAVLAGAQQIMGGLHDVVLVVGAEQQKTMPPAEGADVLGAAADCSTERAQYGDFMFPKLFASIAQVYAERHGLSEAQLAIVAVKNRAHARLNPHAQMRDAALAFEQAHTSGESNPYIAPPLKLSDCSQITDGAAALVLCSERFLKKVRPRRAARLVGYGHTTDYLSLERKEIPDFPIAARAAAQAYAMAGVGPGDIHGAEVHDCFSISEIVQYELLGFAAPGKGAELLESGATALPSVRDFLQIQNSKFKIQNLPVNAGGGLLGDGHPVGATGVRQVVEAHQHLTGAAGARQIAGAKRFLTCNIGGSLTTTVVMIWEAA
jgi:acetyl-CoA C-acetyltransferase